ncbi:hypothetical protein BDR22DRAFT_862587 [Usnea florida]
MNDMTWKLQKLDWQAVGDRKGAEEDQQAERKQRGLDPTPTPYLNGVAEAATRLGYSESLVRYQILAYAERNNFRHSGIKGMAQHGHFNDLGERILEDLRSLEVIFRDRPHEQIQMRSIIRLVEKEWFLRLWFDETGKQRRVMSAMTEKGSSKDANLRTCCAVRNLGKLLDTMGVWGSKDQGCWFYFAFRHQGYV